jgi:hypothetical protein
MLLYHQSDKENLISIIKDGQIKSSYNTKIKNQNPYDVYLKYIFFNTIPDNLKLTKKMFQYGIFFDSSILLNQTFYTNKCHSAGNISSSNKYKFNDLIKINTILDKLYKYSISIIQNQSYSILSVFQEIFIKKEPKLKYAKYISIQNRIEDKDLINLIKLLYPHIQIIVSNIKF